jgi:hypothetical protein
MLFPVHHTDKANGFGVPAKKIQSSKWFEQAKPSIVFHQQCIPPPDSSALINNP